jgi:large subunit ribosomal protein L13
VFPLPPVARGFSELNVRHQTGKEPRQEAANIYCTSRLMKAQTSTLPKPHETREKWYLVDAEGLVVGRVASRVAKLVRGKLNADYAPHLDPKIHVIITNADKIVFTGQKLDKKTYYHHSPYRTGIKAATARKVLQEKPEEILRRAIHGMLPKNRLGRSLDRHVRIYKSGEYTDQHKAQQPEALVIKTRQPKKED